jgi:hypothetical protein
LGATKRKGGTYEENRPGVEEQEGGGQGKSENGWKKIKIAKLLLKLKFEEILNK